MPQIFDWMIHSGELLAFILVAWKVIARLNRDESLKRDYPPHRHINGTRIVYPNEYQPSPVERFE